MASRALTSSLPLQRSMSYAASDESGTLDISRPRCHRGRIAEASLHDDFTGPYRHAGCPVLLDHFADACVAALGRVTGATGRDISAATPARSRVLYRARCALRGAQKG